METGILKKSRLIAIPPGMSPSIEEFFKRDPVMAGLHRQLGPKKLRRKKQIYLRICFAIMSQQLSTKVADTLHRRFLELYGDQEPSHEQILATAPETLRAIGLSNAKVIYVKEVARHFIEQGLTDSLLYKMSDAEVIEELTKIKGVGVWTVQMILMFSLARPDVFPSGDFGIQQAMIRLYKLRVTDKKKLLARMEKIASAWSPYRTVASMYLWQWKDE